MGERCNRQRRIKVALYGNYSPHLLITTSYLGCLPCHLLLYDRQNSGGLKVAEGYPNQQHAGNCRGDASKNSEGAGGGAVPEGVVDPEELFKVSVGDAEDYADAEKEWRSANYDVSVCGLGVKGKGECE